MMQIIRLCKTMQCVCIIIAALAATSVSVTAVEIVALEEIKQDNSCGPRCLNALLQLRDGVTQERGIRGIYDMIGKPLLSPVNMKELREAAVKLGFTAKAYTLDLEQLRALKEYCIVPIGKGLGTKDSPLHFMLVERIQDEYVIFLDTQSYKAKALAVAKFNDVWNGYALVVTSDRRMRPLKEEQVLAAIPKDSNSANGFCEVKDCGHVDKGATVTHTFTIPRENRKEWQVRIAERSCSCLKSELGKDVNDNTTLTVSYKIDGVGWQRAHVAVEIMPDRMIRRYGLVAFGKNSYTVTPENCYIAAPEGGEIEYPFEIQYFTDTEGSVKFDRLECDNKNISMKKIESHHIQGPGGTMKHSFKAVLLYKAGKPGDRTTVAEHKARLIFNTSDGDRTISMDVFAKIGMDRYEVSPKEVFHVASREGVPPIATRVKCRALDRPSAAMSLKVEGKLPIKYSLTSDGECYYVDMELVKESISSMPLGLSKESIHLVDPNAHIPEITIPVRLFIRE